ncbi:MAG TPA: arylesterase [Caulobacteraceae bacterium]|jgi:acyl-CoA thioesterase-1|nr:arylesterase [Caulobacteraceae bacterium]
MPTRRLVLAALTGFCTLPAVAGPVPVVTILGDSITAGLGLRAADALPAQLEAALRGLKVAARVRGAGVSGDTTAGGLARLDFSVQPDTDLCVVELGGNDLLQGVDVGQTRANLDAIVRRLKKRGIAVVLAGGRAPSTTLGSYGRAFDALFPAIAAAQHVALAPDLLAGVMDRPGLKQADGLHPNPAGVKLVAARLAPVVAKALAQRR